MSGKLRSVLSATCSEIHLLRPLDRADLSAPSLAARNSLFVKPFPSVFSGLHRIWAFSGCGSSFAELLVCRVLFAQPSRPTRSPDVEPQVRIIRPVKSGRGRATGEWM